VKRSASTSSASSASTSSLSSSPSSSASSTDGVIEPTFSVLYLSPRSDSVYFKERKMRYHEEGYRTVSLDN
jgi:hypothetical protein